MVPSLPIFFEIITGSTPSPKVNSAAVILLSLSEPLQLKVINFGMPVVDVGSRVRLPQVGVELPGFGLGVGEGVGEELELVPE